MKKLGLWDNSRLRNILILVSISFLLLWVTLSFFYYSFVSKNYENSTLIRLAGIANSVALQIDGNLHESLMKNHPQKDEITGIGQDSVYDHIHNVLYNNFEADMLTTAIYTLVLTDNIKFYEFAVTSEKLPYFRHVYKSFHPILNTDFDRGGMIGEYTDEFGMWLSAFAPIKNGSGKTVAVVMVDEPFNDFVNATRKLLLKTFALSLLAYLLMFGILLWVLRKILILENRDKQAISEMNEENIKIYQELVTVNDKLSKLDVFRKEMISNISHDLRTPMASILGFLELANKPKGVLTEEDKTKYLNIAYSESLRLNRLITDLFELTKLESGQILLEQEPFNVYELVSDIIQKYQLKIKAKHVNLLYEIHENLGLAYGDVKYIDRVFQNLLDNAVRYVDEGGTMKIWILDNVDMFKVKICNTGDLIAKDDLETIFDRYYMTDKNDGTGSGLGLAIAKSICNLHNCTIKAETNEYVNSFWFTVPKFSNKLLN